MNVLLGHCFLTDLDVDLASEKLQQKRHPLFSRQVIGDQGLQPGKSAAANGHGVARRQAGFHMANLFGAQALPDFFDDTVGNDRQAVSKMNHGLDSMGVAHTRQGIPRIETGEEIIWEKRLGEFSEALPPLPFERHAREKNLHVFHQAQMRRGKTLVFDLRAQTKPRRGLGIQKLRGA
ncbi:MAG: hypothetical protein ABSF38_02020 [Verrucomicrobiota bacterium]